MSTYKIVNMAYVEYWLGASNKISKKPPRPTSIVVTFSILITGIEALGFYSECTKMAGSLDRDKTCVDCFINKGNLCYEC